MSFEAGSWVTCDFYREYLEAMQCWDRDIRVRGLTERSTTVLMALSFLFTKSSSCKTEHRRNSTSSTED